VRRERLVKQPVPCLEAAGHEVTGTTRSESPGEEQFELIRRRKFPLVGDGGGVWSFIHVAGAADATCGG
jgi:hypothetical protein